MSGRFNCVLLDVMMPGMDGYQVLQALKSQGLTQNLPIVMVTAHDDAESRERARTAGVDGFISKPFDIQNLVDTIRDLVAAQAEAKA